MIQYNLKCECGKIFDSWFSSSSEFDLLSKKNLLKCIYCNSSAISKSVMAPNLTNKSNNNKSNKVSKKTKLEQHNLYILENILKKIVKMLGKILVGKQETFTMIRNLLKEYMEKLLLKKHQN